MKNKYLNLPNLLTLLRIILILPFFYFVSNSKNIEAVFIIIIAILTDILDGHLSRKLKQNSEFGKWFDVTADGLFIGGSFIILTYYGYVELVITLLVAFAGVIQGLSHLIHKKVIYTKKSKYFGKAVGWFYFALLILSLIYPIIYHIIKWPAILYAYIIELPRLYSAIRNT